MAHNNKPCPGDPPPQKLVIIDINGYHNVSARFCSCGEGPGWSERYRQMLRANWYPATFERPGTGFTFDVLDTYHKITLQGKLNLYDFSLAIMQKTDNCGRFKPLVRTLLYSFCAHTNELNSTGIMNFLVVHGSGDTSN